jgi:hypothetical protein
MDAATEKITRHVYQLIDTNTELLALIQKIVSEVDSKSLQITDYASANFGFMDDAELQIKAIQKKIEDNVATINDLVSKVVLGADYFNNAQDKLYKKAKYITDNLPTTIVRATNVTGSIEFRNVSCFKNWTLAHGIGLKIYVDNIELDYHQTYSVPLLASDNIQFEQSKVFNISFLAPSSPDTYFVTFVVCDADWEFQYSVMKKLYVV